MRMNVPHLPGSFYSSLVIYIFLFLVLKIAPHLSCSHVGVERIVTLGQGQIA